MIESPALLAALIAISTALAFWLDRNVPALSKLGASLLAILFGALLSNFGLVSAQSEVYDVISGPVTSLAIAWLLLAVHIADLRKAGPRMLIAFGIATVGTAVGAVIGGLVFASVFGDQAWRLAGTLTGTYTGGSVNFVAVGRGLELPDTLFAGANAADAVTTALWLGATLMLPIALRRFYPTPIPQQQPDSAELPKTNTRLATSGRGDPDELETQHPFFAPAPVSTLQLSMLAAVGMALVYAADLVAGWFPIAIPSVLWLTTFALLIGHLTPLSRAPGALQLGTLALHFFFVVIGIGSRIADIAAVGIEIFLFTLLVVGVHGVIVYVAGRFARLDLGTISVASQAAVGGPSSALAVAAGREWPALVLPGVMVGLLGYAVGNYLGFGIAYLVRGMLGG